MEIDGSGVVNVQFTASGANAPSFLFSLTFKLSASDFSGIFGFKFRKCKHHVLRLSCPEHYSVYNSYIYIYITQYVCLCNCHAGLTQDPSN